MQSRRIRRLVLAGLVLAAAGGIWSWGPKQTLRDAVAYVLARSPHERYAASLGLRHASGTPAGRAWLTAAAAALSEPPRVSLPLTDSGTFASEGAAAVSWTFAARRGHRLVVDAEFLGPALFVDVFSATGERLASAPGGDHRLTYDVDTDGDLIVRLQPELEVAGHFSVAQRLDASMAFPVEGLTARAVQSMFGASRDAGRRSHEGIDIFAARGTPVLAAADGWVGTSRTNGLGGNVVWIWSPARRVRTYYAHLDRHAVEPGERVLAGDTIGHVGNTGNARGGPSHLHFGVYLAGEGSVDPLPYVCAAPCGR